MNEITSELSRYLEIDISKQQTMEELQALLCDHVNYLLSHDMEKLMRILYQVDVTENSLKTSLANAQGDPAAVIAQMIIERQIEKMKARAQSRRDEDIPENEKW